MSRHLYTSKPCKHCKKGKADAGREPGPIPAPLPRGNGREHDSLFRDHWDVSLGLEPNPTRIRLPVIMRQKPKKAYIMRQTFECKCNRFKMITDGFIATEYYSNRMMTIYVETPRPSGGVLCSSLWTDTSIYVREPPNHGKEQAAQKQLASVTHPEAKKASR